MLTPWIYDQSAFTDTIVRMQLGGYRSLDVAEVKVAMGERIEGLVGGLV